MAINKPSWFSNDKIMVSTAPTCGLTKGGRLLPKIDHASGMRIQTTDPDTGESVDAIDDALLDDMVALTQGETTNTLRFVDSAEVSLSCAVPVYYDQRFNKQFTDALATPRFSGYSSATLGELLGEDLITIRGGHGSPSHDQRIGEVPYIKVSDLRAGFVNINPTNRVPLSVARKFWHGESSNLEPYDLLCPERTSKNIGDFCVLMPGQERVVLTKEIIIIRPGPEADFDVFYLLWALTLKIVRDQWKRIVFMQTNREDVGKRFLEIRIPIPSSREEADKASSAFRNYYQSISTARIGLADYLKSVGDHHFYVAGADELTDELIEDIDEGLAEELPEGDNEMD
ncbi:hypothetical protein OR1_03685 [Geobacter sp. OR-1]|uniref:hypothetical protein n=1 Tax=Geobacter sp. OR-1 TaxID=1266765 RepID=UPI0005422FC6|nr:hypothetical protein [Geobacter sp. OR-1]GAM11370.1 hypothetical protein OR1_03685 [Geobacter sp. OR-1]